MNAEDLKVGRWYYASYGFETVLGQCVATAYDAAILRFRWGGPFRTYQHVWSRSIIVEGEDPRLFGLVALVRRLTSAIDARSAETTGSARQGESAVPDRADAQPPVGDPS